MGRKIKISVQFRVLERLRFQDTKRIVSPEKFRDFRVTGTRPHLACLFMTDSALYYILNIFVLTEDVFLFGSRKTSNSPSSTLVSLYSLVGRLGMY